MARYFTLSEYSAAGDPVPPDLLANFEALAVNVLDPLRAWWGKPIRVTSGYRSPEHNARIGGSKNSDHMKALAADLSLSATADARMVDSQAAAAWLARSRLPFDQAIFYDDSRGGHLHLSYRTNPRREVLHAVANGDYRAWDPTVGEGLQAQAVGAVRGSPLPFVLAAGLAALVVLTLATRRR